jgi:hypothetical protein
MARRSIQPVDLARARARAHGSLRTILSQFDAGEYAAQLHAVEMVEFQVGVVRDVMQPVGVRLEASEKVLNRAYGVPQPKPGPTMVDYGSPVAEGGSTIGEAIEAAKRTADQLQELDAYAGIPVEDWPDRIRAIAGDVGALWAAEPEGEAKGPAEAGGA